MSTTALRFCIVASLVVIAGCGGGGGGGGGGGAPALPAYVNGTTTGQYTSGDLGFYLGARTDPTTPVAATPSPKLVFDIGNGFPTTQSNITWRVLKNGSPFANGTTGSIPSMSWEDIEVPITPGSGTNVYRIEIDHTNAFSETNENNNWVEYSVAIAFPG